MRNQVAIFIDAGYLCALGSTALTGSILPRAQVQIDTSVLVDEIQVVLQDVVGNTNLLRVYWYESSTSNRMLSQEQLDIGQQNGFKLRLVSLHQDNFRSAISSSMSKDLSELGANGAISDALVVARNDTLRSGIEICQSHGVRVHMLEAFPEDDSEFSWLKSDVDTTTAWRQDILSKFLTPRSLSPDESFDTGKHNYGHAESPLSAAPEPSLSSPQTQTASRMMHSSTTTESDMSVELREANTFRVADLSSEITDAIHVVVNEFIDQLYDDELKSCLEFWRTGRGVPNSYDKSLLFECRNALDRNLTDDERLEMRNSFRRIVIKRFGNQQSSASRMSFRDVKEKLF